MKRISPRYALMLITLVFFDGLIWHAIIAAPAAAGYSMTFLDVGQGDSSLLVMNGVRMLTDFGADHSVVDALGRVLPREDKYIDLAVITHSDHDHSGGLKDVLAGYGVGAIIWNGRDLPRGTSASWDALKDLIASKHIPLIVVGEGDRIAYGLSTVDILSPDAMLLGGAATNDSAIVSRIRTPDFTALLTADITQAVEAYIAERSDIHADILKVAHHGSRLSSGAAFLEAVAPRISIIQSGAGNSYGHPHEEALLRIAEYTSSTLFRNDEMGSISTMKGEGGLHVRTERQKSGE